MIGIFLIIGKHSVHFLHSKIPSSISVSFVNTSSSNLEPHLIHLRKFRLISRFFVYQINQFGTNNFFEILKKNNVKCSILTILCELGEFEEFAEALFGQLAVEINEEKEIAKLADRAT